MTGGEIFDDPNRQAVGLDPAWVEGAGGSSGGETPPANPLDAMTKDELLAYASEHGVEADSSMTKADIRAAIDEAAA